MLRKGSIGLRRCLLSSRWAYICLRALFFEVLTSQFMSRPFVDSLLAKCWRLGSHAVWASIRRVLSQVVLLSSRSQGEGFWILVCSRWSRRLGRSPTSFQHHGFIRHIRSRCFTPRCTRSCSLGVSHPFRHVGVAVLLEVCDCLLCLLLSCLPERICRLEERASYVGCELRNILLLSLSFSAALARSASTLLTTHPGGSGASSARITRLWPGITASGSLVKPIRTMPWPFLTTVLSFLFSFRVRLVQQPADGCLNVQARFGRGQSDGRLLGREPHIHKFSNSLVVWTGCNRCRSTWGRGLDLRFRCTFRLKLRHWLTEQA